MYNKVTVSIVNNWPEKFGGDFINAYAEMFQEIDGLFCEKPTLRLIYWPLINRIRLTLGDHDDTDYAKVYLIKNEEEGRKVFHELLNFLNDIADTFIDSGKLMEKIREDNFFPQIPGIKCVWEDEE